MASSIHLRTPFTFRTDEPQKKQSPEIGVDFINVARESGLNVKTIYGGEHKNKYLLETTGCGVAFYDYDNDGWLDIFLVNGSRLEAFPTGQEPTSHLFKNNRDGTFTDVTLKAGLAHSGWGQGVCIGDYDNDGFDDLFVTYLRQEYSLSQQRRWDFYGCQRESWRGWHKNTMGQRMRICGL